MTDEIHYKILKLLESQPDISQRELSRLLGVSLGKANYCIQAMLDRGWIKAKNFKNSRNKIAYAYLLTPAGIENKTKISVRFLKRKLAEFEEIKREIDQLRHEVALLEVEEKPGGAARQEGP